MAREILIGADPELFLQHQGTGKFISAHGIIPGTKYEPHKVALGAVQLDGTAAEFNIDPAATRQQFATNIKAVMDQLKDMAPGYNLVAEPTATFDKAYFDVGIPPEAKRLGCDPDYNAWTYLENPHPEPGGEPLRTGAGHIHIGWTKGQDVFDASHYMECCAVARQMDYYLGIWSLLWDPDPTRRKLYGKAGAFRPKPYGCEYRVMSNAWLKSTILINWVYEAAIAGMHAYDSMGSAEVFHQDLAQHIIDHNETNWPELYDLSDIEVPPLPGHYMKKVG